MLFIPVKWAGLISFKALLFISGSQLINLPIAYFYFMPLPHSCMCRNFLWRKGEKFIVPAWFPICYFSQGEKANL